MVSGQFDGGRDIALYDSKDEGRTYVYVAAGPDGWYVVDVTDPTKSVVTHSQTMSNAGVNWGYRGIAVEPDQRILSITEDIRYADGNQYGYIRFYDLGYDPTTTPPTSYAAKPRIVGREKLAEAFTGIPGRVALMGDYAYVATTGVGIQVVDVKAARSFVGSSDGSTIVGAFDTIGLDCTDPGNPTVSRCGNPSDILVYRNHAFTAALVTTFSGHLVILDLSMPQVPQFITAFKPTNYSAWRVAAEPEYTYIDPDGNSKTIDLAVTGSKEGKIHTLDLTDPYNPNKIGVVKDAQGNERTDLHAMDITISRTSGLAYVTGGNAVYVIDIKDPYNPKLLNTIIQAPTADGILSSLGYSMALVEKDGWVYLANQNKGMRALDLDPVEIGIEEYDKEFGNSINLLAKDYYPALGTKAFKIWGVINGSPLDDKWELCLTEHIPNFKIGVTVDGSGISNELTSGQPCGGSFIAEDDGRGTKKGYITLYVKWQPAGTTTPPLPENIHLKIRARKKLVTTLITDGSDPNASEVCKPKQCTVNVRHNGKTTFQEVLNGQAVFVADGIVSKSTGTTIDKQKFDIVKEMLNQVTPRKRNLNFDTVAAGVKETDQKNYPYHKDNVDASFLDEQSGLFEKNADDGKSRTSQALEIFRRNFSLGDTTIDNASTTFKKLMKDYIKKDADKPSYLYQIVDRETLIGSEKKIWLFRRICGYFNGTNTR